jgi:SSS family solute:Na+ symporter
MIYPIVGVILFGYYRMHPEVGKLMRIPDDALPVFVMNVLPAGARGVMAMAMTTGVLTSMQSGLAAISATIQVNYANRWSGGQLSKRGSVVLARALMLATGLIIICAALGVQQLGQKNSVYQILNMVMYPFTGVLLGIFLLGILTHRANSRGVLIGGVMGFLVTLICPMAHVIAPEAFLGRISSFYYAFVGATMTAAVGYAASYLFAPPPESNLRGLTRRWLPEPEGSQPAPEPELTSARND